MAAKQLSTLQQAALEEKTARDEYEVAAKEAISKIALMDAKMKADAKLNSEREAQEAGVCALVSLLGALSPLPTSVCLSLASLTPTLLHLLTLCFRILRDVPMYTSPIQYIATWHDNVVATAVRVAAHAKEQAETAAKLAEASKPTCITGPPT